MFCADAPRRLGDDDRTISTNDGFQGSWDDGLQGTCDGVWSGVDVENSATMKVDGSFCDDSQS